MRKHLATVIAISVIVLFGFVLFCNYLSSGRMVTVAADAARCKNNLKLIENAKTKWAQDEHKTTNDAPAWSNLVGTNRYLDVQPECGRGGVYTLGRVGETPKCSLPGHAL